MLQLGHFVMNLFPLCLARSRGNLTRLRYQAVTMKCEEVGGAPRSVRPWKPHSTTGSRHTILQSFAAAHEPHQTYPRHMDNELSNTWRNRSCCLYIFSPVLSKTTLQWTLFLLIPFFFVGVQFPHLQTLLWQVMKSQGEWLCAHLHDVKIMEWDQGLMSSEGR